MDLSDADLQEILDVAAKEAHRAPRGVQEIHAFDPSHIPALLVKMAAASGHIIEKTGVNAEQGYSYTEETEVVKATHKALELGLYVSFVPHATVEAVQVAKTRNDNPIYEMRVWQDIVVMDVDTGASYRVAFPGVARDAGDKGIYKALTGAKKYALMETFHISTGADPENPGGSKGVQGDDGGDGGGRQRGREAARGRQNERPPRSIEKGTVTEKQLKDIDGVIGSVKDLSTEGLAEVFKTVYAEMGIERGITRTDLSEEQAAKFINLFQQGVRKVRRAIEENAKQHQAEGEAT